ncbi:RNA-directed DNA polymerase, eukaryota [Tanacetum coccineum]
MVSPSGPGPGPVSIPQPNDPLTQVHSKTHEDLDLYELLSRFQCLSDKANKEPQSIGERKKKHKKKNLIVGISLNCNGLGSLGASGGILTMWDSRVFNLENKTNDSNFLAVMGSWAGSSSKVGLLNIYAPQASALKEQLWSSIEAIVNAKEIIWILFGDFNVVRHIGERVGSLFDAGEA